MKSPVFQGERCVYVTPEIMDELNLRDHQSISPEQEREIKTLSATQLEVEMYLDRIAGSFPKKNIG